MVLRLVTLLLAATSAAALNAAAAPIQTLRQQPCNRAPAIRMNEDGTSYPASKRGAILRSAFLSYVAVESATALVNKDLPGFAAGDFNVFGTLIDGGFLYYCFNLLVKQIIGGQSVDTPTLEGLTAVLKLDVGREPGTWMPKDWAASGARLSLPQTVTFSDEPIDLGFPGENALNGRLAKKLTVVEGGRFVGAQGEVRVSATEGAWVATPTSVPGVAKVRFFLDFPAKATRNDVTLPEGRIFFSSVVITDEADPRMRAAEASNGAVRTPTGALLIPEGGLNVKRNDVTNLFGAMGETMLILGRVTFSPDWSRDGAAPAAEGAAAAATGGAALVGGGAAGSEEASALGVASPAAVAEVLAEDGASLMAAAQAVARALAEREEVEASLAAAVEREDYAAAASLKEQLKAMSESAQEEGRE